MFELLVLLPSILVVRAAPAPSTPPCRFALGYTQNQVLKNLDTFAQDFLYWEGKFHTNDVGYNSANALTYDGALLNWTTGLPWDKHPFSAASKEVLISTPVTSPKLTHHAHRQFMFKSSPTLSTATPTPRASSPPTPPSKHHKWPLTS